MDQGSSFGVVGVFLVLLGAGLILDVDWVWPGLGIIASGSWCFWMEWHRPRRESDTST